MSKVVSTRISSAKEQIENIRTFLTQPVGVFETVDRMVRTFRRANKETLSVIGVRAQITQLPTRLVSKIRRVRRIV